MKKTHAYEIYFLHKKKKTATQAFEEIKIKRTKGHYTHYNRWHKGNVCGFTRAKGKNTKKKEWKKGRRQAET